MIFNGKAFAGEIEKKLLDGGGLRGKKLIIFQADGQEEESVYVRLKHEQGQRLGVDVKVVFAKNLEDLKKLINGANDDSSINGVLVQLPIKDASKLETEKILSTINPHKDVDGLGAKTEYKQAAVVAVERILDKLIKDGQIEFDIYLKVGVVGAKGKVGDGLVNRLRELGYVTLGFDKGDDLSGLSECDVVISATGSEALIGADQVMKDVIAIDLGYPKGDFDPEVAAKAKVFTPVPGGVGPVTVVCLFENLARS